MVNEIPSRKGPSAALMAKASRRGAEPCIVAFDFDGTITVTDSFMAFLKWRAGPARFALGMTRLAPAALAYIGHRDRGRIKAAAVTEFLAGAPREALVKAAQSFATEAWPRLIRPDALACFERWKSDGACVVIVTASPEEIVAPFAERLGADRLLGTRLAFDARDRVTGAFVGGNCRGEEKVNRLKAVFGDGVRLAAAYGDTAGDLEMIAIADVQGMGAFTGRPGPPQGR